MKYQNIIIIVTDSARNFSTGGLDDRDRPNYYNSLKSEFVEFNYAVTSAPSSVMSGATMLTGLSSYFIGRNYDDFRYEKGIFSTLPELVKPLGYNTKGIFVAREMREKILPYIGHIEKQFWPTNISHSEIMWSNEVANIILDNYLAKYNNSNPLFLMLWNNIRHDKNISDNLIKTEQILKKYDFWEDSIIIFCADHGYPHPRRGFTPEGLISDGLTHDLILTDDNILIPLFIKTSKVVPREINEVVGTIDLFPTIIDYIEDDSIANASQELPGRSIKHLIENTETKNKYPLDLYYRCDSRFIGQSDRKTAIRSQNYKYIFNHDSASEEFYDLMKDSGEDVDIINNPEYQFEIEMHRNWFQTEEKFAISFQKDYAYRKIKNRINNNDNNQIIIISLQNSILNETTLSILSNKFKFKVPFFIGHLVGNNNNVEKISQSITELNNQELKSIKSHYDNGAVILVLVVNHKSPSSIGLMKYITRNKFHRSICLDINFSEKKEIGWTFNRLYKSLISRKKFIYEDPLILFKYFKNFVWVKLFNRF
jgi:hypothetical protein